MTGETSRFASDHMISERTNTQVYAATRDTTSRSSGSSTSGSRAAAAGSSEQEELRREEGDMDSLLKLGRVEAIVQGLWQKMVRAVIASGGSKCSSCEL